MKKVKPYRAAIRVKTPPKAKKVSSPVVALPDLSTENPYHDQKITVTLLDTVTGKTVQNSDWSTWWWTEGNGSCDCNRKLFFGLLGSIDSPCVSIRYRVVSVEPLFRGYTLEDFNEGYPGAMDYLDPNATWKYISEYEPPLKEITSIGS